MAFYINLSMKEYFSHDHNARNDRKVIVLVNKYKAAGYGIFWATNEMMHEEGGELELDEMTYSAIAKHLNEDEFLVESVIKDCINVFKLYFLSEGKLTSKRVKRNLTGREDKKNAKSEQAAIAGRLGGIKSGESRRTKQNEANASSERSDEAKLKESKGNESIGKESKLKEIPENFALNKIYCKKYSELNGSFTNLSEKGFLKWKKFVDFIIKNNYEEIFNCKFINPQDFEKLEFPENKWGEVLKSLLSTGIKPEQNLYFRIPQFIKYTEKNGKGIEKVGKSIEFDKA